MILTGKKSKSAEVQKHVEDCINWLNAYFTDAESVTSVHMPDICVANDTGMLSISVSNVHMYSDFPL